MSLVIDICYYPANVNLAEAVAEAVDADDVVVVSMHITTQSA